MTSRNNREIRSKNANQSTNHWSIRHLSTGTASIVVATGFLSIFACQPNTVSASKNTNKVSVRSQRNTHQKANKLKLKKAIANSSQDENNIINSTSQDNFRRNEDSPINTVNQNNIEKQKGNYAVSKNQEITEKTTEIKNSDPTIQESIVSVTKQEKYFEVTYSNNQVARLYVLSPTIFRYYIDPKGKYSDPEQSEKDLNAKIFAKDEYGTDGLENTKIIEDEHGWVLSTGAININFNKKAGTMSVDKSGHVILQETKPIKVSTKSSTQTLKDDSGSNYFGGGTQNGRFNLTGQQIKIENTNNWVDQGVASPNPFYWSSKGYGTIRNTFTPGIYDFDSKADGNITTTHEEERFDAVYFFEDTPYQLIHDYQELTGLPALTPIYGFYEAHLNAYNRDYWVEVSANTPGAIKYPDGKYYKEYQPGSLPAIYQDKAIRETLNGEKGGIDYQFSARSIIDQYLANDMPIGWFLPNDGYGAGYGQTDTLEGNLQNLEEFIKYANSKGIQVGLWTQQNLSPKDPKNPKPDDRDFEQEIQKGVVALKTDVAWVGNGYSFGLNGTQTAAKMIKKIKGDLLRPFIITLDGWAGTQNTGAVWTGDETGGQWEYIRFMIPTYIGSGLSGQPNSASDMDGIFGGGNPIINTRDYQWKAFTPIQLNMDGWGSNPKNPFTFDKTTTSINRAYLKQKTMLMPYIYSVASESTFEGKPMVRAMFLDYPNYPEAYTDLVKYQYMWGENFLIAPIYQNTASDDKGNDIRNGIYLPDENQIWIDYYTGKEYQGGQVLNNFDAPLWKLPVFIKAGAIIPTAPATNTPRDYLKVRNQRQFEIYPSGTSSFTVYEDDGISAQYKNNKYAKTLVKSTLNGSKLIISIDPTTNEYSGIDTNRTTELNVRTQEVPSSISVKVGSKSIELRKASNFEDYQKSSNVYFFDENYLTNPYLKDIGTDLAQNFLRIKLEQTDVSQNGIEVTIDGIKDKSNPLNKIPPEDKNLAIPSDLSQDNEETTSSSIAVSWKPVAGSISYNIKADGVVYTGIKEPKFVLNNLKSESKHTFQIRTVTKTATSPWSEEKTFQSKADVLKNTVKVTYVDTESNIKGTNIWQTGTPGENLFDRDLTTQSHTNWFSDGNDQDATPMTITTHLDGITDLDRFVYVPRNDGGTNGMIKNMEIQTSLDGIHWRSAGSGSDWALDSTKKEIKFAPGTKAYWIKFIIPKGGSQRAYVSGQEFLLYQKEGTKVALPGDINDDGKIDENDVISLHNYAGETRGKDNDFDGYVEKGDLNQNGLIDAFDINYVMTHLTDAPDQNDESAKIVPTGKLTINTDKKSYQEGDTVTVTISSDNLTNTNAFSVRLPYSSEELKFDSIQNGGLTENMINFSKNKVHADNTSDVYVIFSNKGDAIPINGYGKIATVKFKALKPVNGSTISLELKDQMLVNKLSLEHEPEDTESVLIKVKAGIPGKNEPGSENSNSSSSSSTSGNSQNDDKGKLNKDQKDQQEPNKDQQKLKQSKLLMHNSFVYDKDGQRIGQNVLKAGSIIDVYGHKIIINREFYDLGYNRYIAAGNIDGTIKKLRVSSFVYNKKGKRIGHKLIRRNKKIIIYGSAVTIKNKKYFIIGKNKFVKKANFYSK